MSTRERGQDGDGGTSSAHMAELPTCVQMHDKDWTLADPVDRHGLYLSATFRCTITAVVGRQVDAALITLCTRDCVVIVEANRLEIAAACLRRVDVVP